MKTVLFNAPDIVCEGCANAIKKALGKIEGVAEIEVDVAAKTARVAYASPAEEETLTAALDRAGFPVAASR